MGFAQTVIIIIIILIIIKWVDVCIGQPPAQHPSPGNPTSPGLSSPSCKCVDTELPTREGAQCGGGLGKDEGE